MPAYSFKERFVPMILDGTKDQTIRKRRYRQKLACGVMLYLYYGMRTKFCRKLRQELCRDVYSIKISSKGDVFICDERLDDYRFDLWINSKIRPGGTKLNDLLKNKLAWCDGFRPEGSSFENPEGCFDLMLRYWRKNEGLTFYGDIIYWYPTTASA